MFLLNDLLRARLSRGCMIWLLAHPLSCCSKLDQRHTGRLRKRGKLLTGEGMTTSEAIAIWAPKSRLRHLYYHNRIVVQQQTPEFYCTEAYKYPPWHGNLCC